MAMATERILQLVSRIANEEGVQVTVKESFKSALKTGAAAGAGALLAGPIGIIIGAVVGGTYAAATSEHFVSIFEAISNLPPRKKERLAADVRKIAENFGVFDVAMLTIALTAPRSALKVSILNALIRFLKKEMKMEVSYK